MAYGGISPTENGRRKHTRANRQYRSATGMQSWLQTPAPPPANDITAQINCMNNSNSATVHLHSVNARRLPELSTARRCRRVDNLHLLQSKYTKICAVLRPMLDCKSVFHTVILFFFFLKRMSQKNTLNERFSRSLLMERWEIWKHFQIWLFKGPICKKVVIWVSFKNGCFALAVDLTGDTMRREVTLKNKLGPLTKQVSKQHSSYQVKEEGTRFLFTGALSDVGASAWPCV